MSTINTIRAKLHDRVQEKYPHLTIEQINKDIDDYFKYVKRQTYVLGKPEITVGIVGRLMIVKSSLDKAIKTLNTILERDKERQKLPNWKKERMQEKLKKILNIQAIKQDIYTNGKTYKSDRRKRQDGRL